MTMRLLENLLFAAVVIGLFVMVFAPLGP